MNWPLETAANFLGVPRGSWLSQYADSWTCFANTPAGKVAVFTFDERKGLK